MNHLVVKRPDFKFAKDCLNALKKLELKYLIVENFLARMNLPQCVRI